MFKFDQFTSTGRQNQQHPVPVVHAVPGHNPSGGAADIRASKAVAPDVCEARLKRQQRRTGNAGTQTKRHWQW